MTVDAMCAVTVPAEQPVARRRIQAAVDTLAAAMAAATVEVRTNEKINRPTYTYEIFKTIDSSSMLLNRCTTGDGLSKRARKTARG